MVARYRVVSFVVWENAFDQWVLACGIALVQRLHEVGVVATIYDVAGATTEGIQWY